MNKQQKALRLALEALEHGLVNTNPVLNYDGRIIGKAITAIREALAEESSDTEQPAQQQEPVAVHQFRVQGCSDWYDGHPDYSDGTEAYETRTLYTSPPASKPWVGLTDEDDIDWDGGDLKTLVRAIEAKLREKNSP